MIARGLSERQALTVIDMSASSLRYVPAPDRNVDLRARIIALAHRHRRYEVGMIYLNCGRPASGSITSGSTVCTRPSGSRSAADVGRRCPWPDRQPIVRPVRPDDVWSADFVFDRTADGRVLKCLTIVDDATTEAVATIPARSIGGLGVTRVLDRLATVRAYRRCCGRTTGWSSAGARC
jgi:hypothetical protein